jgi:hypothetical protein
MARGRFAGIIGADGSFVIVFARDYGSQQALEMAEDESPEPAETRAGISLSTPRPNEKRATVLAVTLGIVLVEMIGFEPTTSTLRTWRSPS